MCVACHQDNDPDYPSPLMLGDEPDSCGHCHMKKEAVDVEWAREMSKPVHLEMRGEGGKAQALVEALVSQDLLDRGFLLVEKGKAKLDLTLAVRVSTLRDDRFLPPGTPVRAAVIEMSLGAPGEGQPYVRRLGASKPEWGETEEEAVRRAVRDAWAVLSSHLIEALGTY